VLEARVLEYGEDINERLLVDVAMGAWRNPNPILPQGSFNSMSQFVTRRQVLSKFTTQREWTLLYWYTFV